MTDWTALRIGYVPASPDLTSPMDRRRFAHWAARRGVDLHVAQAGEHYDIAVLTTTADITRWVDQARGTRIVYDIVDSYLALSRWTPKSLLRGVAKRLSGETTYLARDYIGAIERMCERADAVVCATPEQAAGIRCFNEDVHVILDVHEEYGATPKTDYSLRRHEAHLVWEGLPHTLGPFRQLTPVLRALEPRWEVHLHLVTALQYRQYAGRFVRRTPFRLAHSVHPRATVHEWDPATVGRIITDADIAVIPLDLHDPFSRGKPENKLYILWRLGMPVVASASPAYRRAMDAAGVDLACTNHDEWIGALHRLLTDDSAREEAGRRGRAHVEAHHTEEQILARWDAVLESVLRRSAAG